MPVNVRRSDGRILNWVLDRERDQGEEPEPGYCRNPECEGWASNPEVKDGIRWCDGFWQHAHVEDWNQLEGQPMGGVG